MTQAEPDWIPELDDRYPAQRILGRGGMAVVWLVKDLRHDRLVALKIIRPELTSGLLVDRFHREIRLAAGLQHPNIVTVFDSGDVNGRLWYTMPWVEGESLRDRLKRESRIGLDDALRITRGIAAALNYAHAHGVIHRDIKPENVLIAGDHPLLTDFGIARALGDDSHLTSTGVVLGTPLYMSPEQSLLLGEVDARSDVYSLACILYEMLAGEPPYIGSSAQSIIAKRLVGPVPDIQRLRPNTPAPVASAIARGLATAPGDRFATAAAFAHALVSAVETAGASTSSTSIEAIDLKKQPHKALLFGVAALIVVIAGWWWAHRGGEGSATAPARLAVIPFENQGRPEDEYFADGFSDELRGKLTAVAGLEVIARASSSQYRRSAKSPEAIAKELGVQYLLMGTVRWQKGDGAASRVRVSPELVEVGRKGAQSRWQAPFDAPMTDVFQVQSAIAGEVVQALNVQLSTRSRETLARPPTSSLAAYDAYLQAISDPTGGDLYSQSADQLRAAIVHLERAVDLDSTFALAWAQLSIARTYLWENWFSDTLLTAAAWDAAVRASRLEPAMSTARLANGIYYIVVLFDSARAAQEAQAGLATSPNDPDLLAFRAYFVFDRARPDSALALVRRAQALNPRSPRAVMQLWTLLMQSGRFQEAVPVAERAVQLAPTSSDALYNRILGLLAVGDTAQATLRATVPPPGVDSTALRAATDGWLIWLRTPAQIRQLVELQPSAYGGDSLYWAWTTTIAAWQLGDSNIFRSRVALARQLLDTRLKARPKAPNLLFIDVNLRGVVGDRVGIANTARLMGSLPDLYLSVLGPAIGYTFVGQSDSAAKYWAVGFEQHMFDKFSGVVRYAPYMAAVRRVPTFRPTLDSIIARSRR